MKSLYLPCNSNRRNTEYLYSIVTFVYSTTIVSLLESSTTYTHLLVLHPCLFAVDVYYNCHYRSLTCDDSVEYSDTFAVGCYSFAVDGDVELVQVAYCGDVELDLDDNCMVPVG